MRWFHDTLVALGMAHQVSLFTASDLGPGLRGREVRAAWARLQGGAGGRGA